MAVTRVISRGRCCLFRSTLPMRITPTKISAIAPPISTRQFSSSTPAWEDIIQTPSRGPEISLTDTRIVPNGSHAQSIALLKLPIRLAKSELEELLRSKGFNINKLQMRFNRFTFHNDTMAFSELGSEEEAAKAVDQLNNTELQGKKIVVKKMQPDFQWERTEMSKGPFGSRYFYDEADNAEKALRPLAEGRRYMLRVQTPGWTVDVVSSQVKNAVRIIQENFEGYGIENIGDIHPFYGDLKTEPRLLCYMDFKTKEGADEAVQKHHDTEIGGRRTWLTPCTPNSYRTHHMAKVAPKLVAEMQEQGILPKETREDLFVNPLPEKESK